MSEAPELNPDYLICEVCTAYLGTGTCQACHRFRELTESSNASIGRELQEYVGLRGNEGFITALKRFDQHFGHWVERVMKTRVQISEYVANTKECENCAKKPNERNHPPGMVFVGWGHGWQPCSYCGGSARVPATELEDCTKCRKHICIC